jgi:hypothetical protein
MSIAITDTESTVRAIRPLRLLEHTTLAVDTNTMSCHINNDKCFDSEHIQVVRILTARKNHKLVDGEMGKANWTMSSRHWEEKEKGIKDVVLEEEAFIKG